MAAIAAGCAKEPANPETEKVNDSEDAQVPQTELVSYSFSATLEAPVSDDPVEGKASISDAGVFSWSAGDEIAVWNAAESAFVTFTCNAGDGVFTASATPGAEFTKAYYPASVAVAGNPDQVNLASSYSLAESTSGKFFPMVATVSGSNLAFTHLGSLLKFTINDVPADATSLTLTSATAVLSGNFAVQSGQINAGSGAGSVSVSISHSVKENLAFYFPVPVGNYSYTITLGDGTTTMLTQATTSAKTLARASFHGLKALTVSSPTTTYRVCGWFAYNGNNSEWTNNEALTVPFVESDVYGWLKACNVGTRDGHVSFKLIEGVGSWDNSIGTTETNGQHNMLGTMLGLANAGGGNDITLYTTKVALLDVYYNPSESKLFVVEAGTQVTKPVFPAMDTNMASYTLIGYHSEDSWSKDYLLEGAQGSTDWWVARNVTTAGSNPHIDVKFRKDGNWTTKLGCVKYDGVNDDSWNKTAGALFDLKSHNNDADSHNITFYGESGSYNIYLNSNLTSAVILPSSTPFVVPSIHEVALHYSLTGIFSINSTDYNWNNGDVDIDLELVDGTTTWLVAKNVSPHSDNASSGYLKFKFRLDKAWTDGVASVGDSNNDPWKDVGNFYDSNVSTSSKDIQVYAPANVCPVDVYLKTDLSKFGVFTHGSAPVFP